jgi:hypothetical protein
MDQGWAAVIAGIAGTGGALGGSIVGAIAPVRGTRIGAERTAQATLQQVRDQAVLDHAHWLRQQRQEAYVALLGAYDTFAVEMRRTVGVLEGPNPQEAEIEAIQQAVFALEQAQSRIPLLGPEPAREAGIQLQDAVVLWGETVVRPVGDGVPRISALVGDYNARQAEAPRRHGEFRRAARDVLLDPDPEG